MKTLRVNSVSEYINELEKLGIEKYIYRGQNEPYHGIEANGFRPYKGGWDTDKIFNINTISNSYFNRVIAKLSDDEKRYFLAFCQHYGIPTNLIDFSYSPIIALFFACHGKHPYQFSLQELIGDMSVTSLKKDTSLQNMLIHNLINTLEKETISDFAQVYLLDKKWLLDITEIIIKLEHENFFESLYSDKEIRVKLIYGLTVLFENLDVSDIVDSLIQIITCYEENNVDFYGDELSGQYEDEIEYNNLFTFREQLKCNKSKDVILCLYCYVFNKMEDERIPYESDIFDDAPEIANIYQLSAATYVLLLANLIQIFDNDMNNSKKLYLNLKIYFTYQPANLFDRIDTQKGLFVYQPYLYSQEDVYKYNILSTQNINPDVCIEINNYSKIIDELDSLGIDIGKVYGDLDNIAKAVLLSYKRNNDLI